MSSHSLFSPNRTEFQNFAELTEAKNGENRWFYVSMIKNSVTSVDQWEKCENYGYQTIPQFDHCGVNQIMKTQFANLKVDCWIHDGRLGLSETSLCMFRSAGRSGTEILDALLELKTENFPVRLQLTFANRRNEGAVTSLRLMLVPARDDLRVMCIRFESGSATIEMTDMGLRLMIDAVGLWLEGAEDFGISPRNSPLKPKDLGVLDLKSAELWFWGPCYAGP